MKKLRTKSSVCERLAVRWEGAFFVRNSLAYVNHELCIGLLKSGQVDLSLAPTTREEFGPDEDTRFAPLADRAFTPLPRRADVHVRHQFPPHLRPPPDTGHYVLIQPWEFGSLPKQWVEPICAHASEVWCYSQYMRDVYADSGIPEERLQIIPLGVDTSILNADAPPYVFTTQPGAARISGVNEPPFIFLFVGGTIHRKGIDILLQAYLQAFSALDNVCLVIKDTCVHTAYRDQNHRDQILGLTQDTTRPSIIYLDADLPPHQLAGLYTGADCLVAPYRGEAFCLPVLEAMACGTPVIVTSGGATDDFVDESVGWRLEAEKRCFKDNMIGEWECVSPPWLMEVEPDVLARQMRDVYSNSAEAARRGASATQRVAESWTWDHACGKVLARLVELKERPQHARTWPAVMPVEPDLAETKPEATISLCMIVRDEERVLADCLRSAKPWFDEIIVVDTGSKDGTVEIAERFGARVFHFPWVDSFAAARNESLRHATGNWIFWMDADDTLPWHSGDIIRHAPVNAPEDVAGFIIPVRFVDEGAAGTQVDHVKLFRNFPGLAFEGRIHEQVIPSLRTSGGTIARLDAVVLHTGYDTSPEGQAKKRKRDLKLLKLDYRDRPDHPFVLFNLGMTYHYLDDHPTAIRWFRKCLKVSDRRDSHVRKVFALLAGSLREMNRDEEALKTLYEGLTVTPEDPELHFHAGRLLTELGRLHEAKGHYLQVIEADISGHFSSVDVSILGYKTFHNLAGLCKQMGNYSQARMWWLKALADAPTFLISAFELFQDAIVVKDFDTAWEMVDKVRRMEGQSENWAKMAAQLAESSPQLERPETILHQAVVQDRNAVGPRLELARRFLRSGNEEEALSHLEVLNEAGVAEAAFYLGVGATRRGDYRQALQWMERAHTLNPAHAATREQVANLHRMLDAV